MECNERMLVDKDYFCSGEVGTFLKPFKPLGIEKCSVSLVLKTKTHDILKDKRYMMFILGTFGMCVCV